MEADFSVNETTTGKLASLSSNPVSGSMQFPKDVQNTGQYVTFTISDEYIFDNKATTTYNTKAIITLPVPSNLATAYGVQYQNESLGIIGSAAAGITNAGFRGDVNSALSKAKDLISRENVGEGLLAGAVNAFGSTAAPIVSALIGGSKAAIASAVAGSVVKGAVAGAGVAVNPHQATLFQGVNFRQHQFNYKLTASNRTESDVIQKIINTIKFYMHPEYTAQNHFFKYPAQVFVNFSNPYTFKIAASVITSLSVDYHGDGGPYYFKDNRPYSVNLNFQLQEIAINTRKEIREGR